MRQTWFHAQMLQSPQGFLHMADVTDTFYASDAAIGYGAQFKVGQGDSPQTFVAMPVTMTITPGALTTGVVPATHLRSPNRHTEKKFTLRDSAAIAMTGSYLPGHGAHKIAGGDGFDATHNLIYLWINVVENDFEIEYPADLGSLVISVRGAITKYQPGQITTEGLVPFDFEITPSHDYFTGPA